MSSWVSLIESLGNFTIEHLLLPLIGWTIMVLIAEIAIQYSPLDPGRRYQLRSTLLFTLPAGLLTASSLSQIPAWLSPSSAPIQLLVIKNPLIVSNPTSTSGGFTLTPAFWTGILVSFATLSAMVQLFRLGLQLINLYRYRLELQTRPIEQINLSAYNRRQLADLRKDVLLGFAPDNVMPMTFGWIQPVIVVSTNLLETPDKLNLVLRHELSHIKRADYLHQTFYSILKALFWFHPLIAYLNKQLEQDREMACDREVLNHAQVSSRDYAQLLFDLTPQTSQTNSLSLPFAHQPSNLKERIRTMMDSQPTKRPRFSTPIIIVLFLSITGLMACTEMQNQAPDGSALLDQKLKLDNPTVSINGQQYSSSGKSKLTTPANGITWISLPNGRTFAMSGQKFKGAQPIGEIRDNKIRFDINMQEVVITSEFPILDQSKAQLWVAEKHTKSQTSKLLFGSAINYKSLQYQLTQLEKDGSPNRNNGSLYTVVDKMPKLIGGLTSIQSKISYPESAKEKGIQGRVFVEFVVDENGQVTEPKVVKGIGSGGDREALEAVKTARFEPGMKDGEAVPVKITVPVVFRLNGS